MNELRWKSFNWNVPKPSNAVRAMDGLDGAVYLVLQSRHSVGFTDADDPVWSEWQDVPVEAP